MRIRLWTDRGAEEKKKNRKLLNDVYKFEGLPLYVFLTPDGREVARLPSSLESALPSMREFLDAFRKTEEQSLKK